MKAARTRALNRKHAGTSKHSSTAKHTPTAHRRSATAHKQTARRTAAAVKAAHLRAWTPGGAAMCAAAAFAQSLRLSGGAVTDSAALAIYRYAADAPDAGASIVATADAVLAAGMGGVWPLVCEPADPDDPAAVILGLDMPEGRHTVCLDPSGLVWSWGELWELTSEALIEEAWAVTWP